VTSLPLRTVNFGFVRYKLRLCIPYEDNKTSYPVFQEAAPPHPPRPSIHLRWPSWRRFTAQLPVLPGMRPSGSRRSNIGQGAWERNRV